MTPAETAAKMVAAHGRTEARRRAVEQASSPRMNDRAFWVAVVAAIDGGVK